MEYTEVKIEIKPIYVLDFYQITRLDIAINIGNRCFYIKHYILT